MADERIQKLLARAGYGARRNCEELITGGRVTVNGVPVIELGTRADPARDDVRLDGSSIFAQAAVYYMLNKPAGCLTTAAPDRHGRPIVMQYVEHLPVRVFPVGRLDFDTEGLLLFTNDGRFANTVTHPGHSVVKVYEAVVENRPQASSLAKLERGVLLEDGPAAPSKVRVLGKRTASVPCKNKPGGPVAKLVLGTVVEIRIQEGRKRIVKRMLNAVGHPVLSLRRTAIGLLTLGDLKPGEGREITPDEIKLIVGGDLT